MIKSHKQSKDRILKVNPDIILIDINSILLGNSNLKNLSLGKIKLILPYKSYFIFKIKCIIRKKI